MRQQEYHELYNMKRRERVSGKKLYRSSRTGTSNQRNSHDSSILFSFSLEVHKGAILSRFRQKRNRSKQRCRRILAFRSKKNVDGILHRFIMSKTWSMERRGRKGIESKDGNGIEVNKCNLLKRASQRCWTHFPVFYILVFLDN